MAIIPFYGNHPVLHNPAFIAPSADIIGSVHIAEGASVWFNVTLRGDVAAIYIGRGSNVQDNTCIHVERSVACTVGEHVTIGHSVTLHACTIEDNCLIGMGAIVLDGATIGHGSIVGAHALVTKNTIIPPYSLVLGSPAKVIRQLSPTTEKDNYQHALEYIELAKRYQETATHPETP